MTDPTPFERFQQRFITVYEQRDSRVLLSRPDVAHALAAAFRELRDNPGGAQTAQRDACIGMKWPGSPDKMRDAVELAQWQAGLDAVLADAPEKLDKQQR